MRKTLIGLAIIITFSFTHSLEEEIYSSPSPQGDTRIGADAASSGTNISDKEIQAQEDKTKDELKSYNPKNQSADKKNKKRE